MSHAVADVGSAAAIAARVRSREVPAVVVARETIAAIRARDPAINAFTEITERRALDEAARVDAMLAGGQDPGPLAGVPYAVKNLFDVAGLPTLAGSRINRERAPATRDATLVERLGAAGAVLVGTLNMDEYAYGFTTENTHYGPTRNPHRHDCIAGGSSGGSAAAVAARLVPITLGSDTNGSIRVPASYCGVFGLKPTYGGLSRGGSFPFVGSLDHVGPLARSVADLAAVYDAVRGEDPRDPVCRPGMPEPVGPILGAGVADIRIARLTGYFEQHAEPDVVALVARAAAALGVQRTAEIPEAGRARAAAFVMTACEGAQLHLQNLRTRADDFEPLIRDRLISNALIPAAWYLQAQRFRRWFHGAVMQVLEGADVLLAPATPRPAHPIGADTFTVRGVGMLSRPNVGLLTQPVSFIGLPVVAAPVGLLDGLPVGMQIIAAPGREDLCLRVARALERSGIAHCQEPA
jgi:AtzE family amidohydrolase